MVPIIVETAVVVPIIEGQLRQIGKCDNKHCVKKVKNLGS